MLYKCQTYARCVLVLFVLYNDLECMSLDNFENKAIMLNEREKPPYLYHASVNRDVEEFEPKAETVRHPEEGPKVFAIESPEKASVFMVRADDSWSQFSRWRDTEGDEVVVAVYSDRERFEKNDKGGSIYALPSDTFEVDEEFTKSSKEWTSSESVAPVKKKDYDSGLDAMLDFGVQVYFVTPERLEEMRESEDHGYSILKGLKSENEKSGRNPKAL